MNNWTVTFDGGGVIKCASYPHPQLVWRTKAEARQVATEHRGGTAAPTDLAVTSVEVLR